MVWMGFRPERIRSQSDHPPNFKQTSFSLVQTNQNKLGDKCSRVQFNSTEQDRCEHHFLDHCLACMQFTVVSLHCTLHTDAFTASASVSFYVEFSLVGLKPGLYNRSHYGTWLCPVWWRCYGLKEDHHVDWWTNVSLCLSYSFQGQQPTISQQHAGAL